MSELVVLGLKVGFLALLWLFILFTGNVIRIDLFGRKVPAAELSRPTTPAQGAATKPPKISRRTLKQLPKTLTVTHGKQAGLQLPLGEAVLIGRASDCQLILDDDYVSTRHARISRTPTGFQVEDLGSTNGTFVNNQRISAPTPFGVDDTLRIGRTLMGVER
ncbi:FHA domain-containing protein [Propionicimonas sp.]|uniref:FHA domain-containing protein FhaB/FipA n=1 Tax=Propionicimonas sp. TaxID=1955623 RepID=UPI0039E3878F